MTRARDLADGADKDITGTLTLDDIVLSNDMSVADNGKVQFGAGNDLQIFHNASASYITDQGTGNLVFGGDAAILLQNSAHSANMLDAYNGGRVGLYHNGTLKAATTSTGVDVTGTVTVAHTGTNASPHIKLAEAGDTREFNIFNDGSGNGRLVLADSTDDTPDTEIVLADNGQMQFKTGNTERLRIDSSGNVGIGTSTVDSALHINQDASGVTETSGSTLKIHNTNASGRSKISLHNSAETASGSIYYDTDVGGLALQGDTGAIVTIHTGGNNERMRVDSSGSLLVGTTSASMTGFQDARFRSHANGKTGIIVSEVFTDQTGIIIQGSSNSGNRNAMVFLNGGLGTVGSVVFSSSSTSYNTSSDHRLKQGVEDMTGAIDRVKALAPKRFQFIADTDTTVDGFLAHEAQAVVPEAVTGTHNEVETWTQQQIDDGDAPDGTSAGDNKLDGDGNTIPVMQGIDQSKLVPLLTGALQEAIAKIETLETKVAALEAAE